MPKPAFVASMANPLCTAAGTSHLQTTPSGHGLCHATALTLSPRLLLGLFIPAISTRVVRTARIFLTSSMALVVRIRSPAINFEHTEGLDASGHGEPIGPARSHSAENLWYSEHL